MTGRFAVLCLALLLTGIPSSGDTAARDADEIEARLEQLRAEISTIEERLAADRQAHDSATQALAAAEREIGRLGRALHETEATMAEVRAELEQLRARERVLDERLETQQAALGEQLRSVHRLGNRSRLRLILSQNDPERLSRMLAYYAYLTGSHAEMIGNINEQLRELADIRTRIENRRDELAQLERDQKADLENQQAARRERARAVAEIETRMSGRESELEALRRDAAELETLLDELSTALADIPRDVDIPALDTLKGRLPMPVAGPVDAAYGQSRAGELTWNGWLIRAGTGSEVTAVAHGRVAYADWLRGYGLLIIIDHGDGYMSLYAHNDTLLNDVGDWVSPGDVIATVGNSGGLPDPALYFELRSQGRAVDPAQWIDR